MAESNKITAFDFEQTTNANAKQLESFEWNGLGVEVKRVLTVSEMIGFVDYVTKLCFDEATGEYMPEIRDFAISSATVTFYTNIDLPQETESKYKLLYMSDIVGEVYKHICEKQFIAICTSINTKLEYLASSKALLLQKEFEKTAQAFADVLEKINNIFNGVGKEEVSNIINSLSNIGFDEGKLLNAIVSEYNSDSGNLSKNN